MTLMTEYKHKSVTNKRILKHLSSQIRFGENWSAATSQETQIHGIAAKDWLPSRSIVHMHINKHNGLAGAASLHLESWSKSEHLPGQY